MVFILVPDGQYCNCIRILQGSPVSLPGPQGRDSGGVKTPFSFFSEIASKASIVAMPVLNKDFCSCTLPTALLVTLHESKGEALGPPWKKSPPQHWTNSPAPLAHLGAEIPSWQQTFFYVRAVSAITLLEELLGLDN